MSTHHTQEDNSVKNFWTYEEFDEWKRNFPNPDNSPAHPARSLFIGFGAHVASEEDHKWIKLFTNVEHLKISALFGRLTDGPFIIPSGALTSVKSLTLDLAAKFPSSEILRVIGCFPSLEDLYISSFGQGKESNDIDWDFLDYSTMPKLTGTLVLGNGSERILGILSKLDPCFRKIVWDSPGGLMDPENSTDACRLFGTLVQKFSCSDNLESIDINLEYIGRGKPPIGLDLSKATKLKEVVFRRSIMRHVELVDKTLKTITPKHEVLQKVSISSLRYLLMVPENIEQLARLPDWISLDDTLSKVSVSQGIRITVVNDGLEGVQAMDELKKLFPETAGKGLIDISDL